jgi:hypothetical protein
MVDADCPPYCAVIVVELTMLPAVTDPVFVPTEAMLGKVDVQVVPLDATFRVEPSLKVAVKTSC